MKTWQLRNSDSLESVIKKILSHQKQSLQQFFAVKFFTWGQKKNKSSGVTIPQVHDYRKYKPGVDYFFDIAYPSNTAMMTGSGTKIKPSDYFLLFINGHDVTYQVIDVDYYTKFSDIWIVSLKCIYQTEANTYT